MKDTVKRIKGHATDWEEIFSKHMYDKEIISKLDKELLNLNSKKTNNLILK